MPLAHLGEAILLFLSRLPRPIRLVHELADRPLSHRMSRGRQGLSEAFQHVPTFARPSLTIAPLHSECLARSLALQRSCSDKKSADQAPMLGTCQPKQRGMIDEAGRGGLIILIMVSV